MRTAGSLIALVFLAATPLTGQGGGGGGQQNQIRQFIAVDSGVVAITHVRVIDGTGAAPADDQTVVLTGRRITAVGPFARTTVPPGARVIDGTGKTVIPGLFGMHDHTFYPAGGQGGQRNHHLYSAPRLYLANGVTSIRTAGTYEPYNDLNMKESIDRGAIGPRINATGAYVDANRGRVNSVDDAKRLVNYWAEEGAIGYKAYTNIRRDELKAAIDEAHKRGLKVTGHLCSVTFREAAAMGIDNLEHGYQVATDWDKGKKPDECRSEGQQGADLAALDINGPEVQAVIQDMVRYNVALTTTPAVHECAVPGRPPLRPAFVESLSPITRETRVGASQRSMALADSAAKGLGTAPARVARSRAVWKKNQEFDRAFVKAGGHLMAGLDPTGSGCSLFGFGDQRNLVLLVEAGFSPAEAVKIASFNGAQFLGQSDSLGSITVGKIADLVLVDGNLVANMTDIEKTSIVFKNGIGWDTAKLIASVKGQVGVN
jgi:imidazolonepropionase-like amidohydrolase